MLHGCNLALPDLYYMEAFIHENIKSFDQGYIFANFEL